MRPEDLMKIILDEFNNYTVQQTLAICSCLEGSIVDLDYFIQDAPNNSVYKYSLDEVELVNKLTNHPKSKRIIFRTESPGPQGLSVYSVKKEDGKFVVITKDYDYVICKAAERATRLIVDLVMQFGLEPENLDKISLIEAALKVWMK